MAANNLTPKKLFFSNIEIPSSNIFYLRKYVFAFVNLKPFSKGHVLLCPIRIEKKYKDLNEIEAIELWISAVKIASNLKKYYNTDRVNIAIQDGELAGQTIPHCHIHIIPIINNNTLLENKLIDDKDKKERSAEDMEKEAIDYKSKFVLN